MTGEVAVLAATRAGRPARREAQVGATDTADAADRTEILALIRRDVAAYLAKDLSAWADCYVQDARMTSLIGRADRGIHRRDGFEAWHAGIAAAMAREPAPSSAAVRQSALRISICGDMAWATFDEHVERTGDPMEPPTLSHNIRVFERVDGRWRIALHVVMEPRRSAARGPLIELDADGRVLWMSPAAAARLPGHDGLTVSAGRLRATRRVADRDLQAAIRRAAGLCSYTAYVAAFDDAGPKARFPVMLGEDEAGGALLCTVMVDDYTVFVSFDDGEDLARRLRVAGAVFALSPGQERLALEIAGGHDLGAAAERMSVTLNTARTHLRRMFDKTGVNSQAALMRLLLSIG